MNQNHNLKDNLRKLKILLLRIYHPCMSAKSIPCNVVEYVGNKNAALIAAIVSLLVTLLSFVLFAVSFALIFSVLITIAVFVLVKFIVYQPQTYSIQINGKNSMLSFVKDIQLSGKSNIAVHTQPEYSENTNTFINIQLYDSFLLLNCNNINSLTDNSYRDISISFFHPIAKDYSITAKSTRGAVNFDIVQQSPDQCQIIFLDPIRKIVQLEFKPN